MLPEILKKYIASSKMFIREFLISIDSSTLPCGSILVNASHYLLCTLKFPSSRNSAEGYREINDSIAFIMESQKCHTRGRCGCMRERNLVQDCDIFFPGRMK